MIYISDAADTLDVNAPSQFKMIQGFSILSLCLLLCKYANHSEKRLAELPAIHVGFDLGAFFRKAI